MNAERHKYALNETGRPGGTAHPRKARKNTCTAYLRDELPGRQVSGSDFGVLKSDYGLNATEARPERRVIPDPFGTLRFSSGWRCLLLRDDPAGSLAAKMPRCPGRPMAEPSGRRSVAGSLVPFTVHRGGRAPADSPAVAPWRETPGTLLPRHAGCCGQLPRIAALRTFPVDEQCIVASGFRNAEPAELARPAGSGTDHLRNFMVGAGIGVGQAVPQHHVQGPRHLPSVGDDGAAAAPPRHSVSIEALELEIVGALAPCTSSAGTAHRCGDPFRAVPCRCPPVLSSLPGDRLARAAKAWVVPNTFSLGPISANVDAAASR